MNESSPSRLTEKSKAVRFGMFEVDLQARELRKRGMRLKLQEKPFQILELLLERAGQLVTRAELRKKLWPDTYVGFDRSLNTAVNKLRQVLGDTTESPRFVETRQRLGYRFIAPVESPRAAFGPGDSIGSIAVLPFINVAGDPEMEYLSDGISESIIHNLSQLPGIRVMARSTVFRYKGRDIDPQAVGRELNVQALLTGRVVERADTLMIGTELVDVENGFRLWGEQYNRRPNGIFSLEEEISRDITEKLRLRLTDEQKQRLQKRYTENTEAYRDYLKGRYHLNRYTEDGMKRSIEHFERAIARDPRYALAYAGLADVYGLIAFFNIQSPRETMPKAKEAALKALAIDDGLAEAHASLASVLKSYDWNWAGAEQEFQRSIELSPNNTIAHHFYADFLSALGRPEEALREIQRAQELDPLSVVISMEVGWNLYMARDFARAAEQARKTMEMEPTFPAAHHVLGLACEQLARYQEAMGAFEKAVEYSGNHPAARASLGHAYAAAGRKREAIKILRDIKEVARQSFVSPYLIAVLHSGLGETNASFEWLEKAMDERDMWLQWLNRDPRFDTLRSDARFQDLLKRVGLQSPPRSGAH